jgi:hypothetical protein
MLTHSRHGSRGGETEVMGLENKVNIGAERDPLSVGEGQEVVVVKHRVE